MTIPAMPGPVTDPRAYDLRERYHHAAFGGAELRARRGGLVAYLDGEPVGWCAVEPSGGQDRRRRLGRDLLRHPRGFPAPRRQPCARRAAARQRGARALEGYPMITQPGQEITWGGLRVGSRSIFAAAGFAEVSRPTPPPGRDAHRLLREAGRLLVSPRAGRRRR
jgi:hypothetical protein